MSDVNSLVNALGNGDNNSANNAFNTIMKDKLQAALDAKKIEMADRVYNGVTDQEIETDVDIQGTEADAE